MTLIGVAIGVTAALYSLFLHRLGDRDLWNSHEARAAMNARSMINDGNWILPRLADGRMEIQKPPLYYWMVAGLARISGGEVNAWHVRLPSALSALGCLLILIWLGFRLGNPRLGISAALILACALHFTWLARVGRIDMPLTFFITLALACFFVASRWSLVVGYFALAAAVLLKGPIGLVLPAVVLIAHFVCEGSLTWNWRSWLTLSRRLGLWWGLPLILLLTVPWFVLAHLKSDGEFTRSFFWLHNFQRGLGGSRLRGHSWWRYGPQFLFDFLPWTPLLLWLMWRRREKWSREAKLGLVWLLSMVLLLSLSRYKRADYLMPVYPGAALLLAGLCQSSGLERWLKPIVILCVIAWLIRVEVYLPRVETEREFHTFAEQIRTHAQGEILFFRTESHALAFHLQRPIRTVVQWEKLDNWPTRSPVWVVMPQKIIPESENELFLRRLVPVESTHESHEKPMRLFKLVDR